MADVITRLKVDNSEYDNKLKRASNSLAQMSADAQKAGNQIAVFDKNNVALARSLGSMQTVAKNAKGKISELTNAFTEASLAYKHLSDQEKNSPFGKALGQSVEQLKSRVMEAKSELADINKQIGNAGSSTGNATGAFGNFSSVLGELGSRFGVNSDLMSVVTTGTIGMTAAIGAAAAGAAAAAKAWADYNSELAKQDQMTTVITGLSGEDAQQLTDFARSISDTYGTDFRGNIDAVNTLMQQFGISSEQAMNILADGMQGMIQGDGQKLLSMIGQYAPAFRDAGVEASQLVAVINNTEGGLFTDQNMAAITMGIKNIRLMKDTTKESLEAIGIDADAMAQKLNDGTMSVFDALQEVSGKISEVGEGSQAAGEVMNDVFGRQGVTAGTKLGEAIASLNTNLEETKGQTGEVGAATANLQKAQQNLQSVLRQVFGTSAEGWEKMKTDLKTKVIRAIQDVLTWFVKIYNENIYVRQTIATTVAVLEGMWEAIKVNVKNTILIFKSLGEVLTAIVHSIELVFRGDFEGAWNSLKGIGGIATDFWNEFKANGKDATSAMVKIIQEAIHSTLDGHIDLQLDVDTSGAGYGSTDYTPGGGSSGGGKSGGSHGGGKSGHGGGKSGSGGKSGNTGTTTTPKPENKKEAEWIAGVSGLNADAFNAYSSMLKDAIKKADIGSDVYESLSKNLADTTALNNLLNAAFKNGVDLSDFDSEGLWDKILNGEDIPDETWQSIVDVINKKLEELKLNPIKLDFTTGSTGSESKKSLKVVATQSLSELQTLQDQLQTVESSMNGADNADDYKAMQKEARSLQKQIDKITGVSAANRWNNVANAASSFGQALQNLGDKGTIGVVGLVASAIGQLIAQFAAIPKGATVWDWIAGSMAGVATLTSVVSQIESLSSGSYATGGIIPGNNHNDGLVANVSSGELILNRAQQGNLASQLDGAGLKNLQLETILHGEDIKICLKYNDKRRKR